MTSVEGQSTTVIGRKPDRCRMCPAYLDPGPVLSSPPTRDLRAIVVGEAPGHTELQTGEGFTGASGGLLWMMAKRIGLNREECYVANTAKCITKSPAAFKYCYDHFLSEEIKNLPNDIPIIALGEEAKKQLAPDLNAFTITTARGCKSGRVICALHPAYIHRTIRQSSEEKQDLSPTLAWDIKEGVEHKFDFNRVYINPIPLVDPNHHAFVSCDLETDNTLDPRHGPIDQIGFGTGYGTAVREKYREENREIYQKYLSTNKVIFHNMVFDLDWLEYNGYSIPDPEDTMGAAHLLDPDFPLGLDFQNTLYVHYRPWKSSKRRDEHGYHATDLDVTYQCWDRMQTELKLRGLWSLYEKEWKPVTLACLKMKQGGMKIDRMKMLKLNIALGMKLKQIDSALTKIANIDWGSSKQVMGILYDKFKLPQQLHRKSGRPTSDADALEELAQYNNPAVGLLRARRQIDKMRSTYTDYNLDGKDFLHSDVSFTAATGRARGFLLTLQRGAMRSLFIPDEPGWKMAYADWDRVELWISAVLSRDTHFQEILANVNFHEYCGTQVFGTQVSKKLTPELYHSCKFITHGINFGRGEVSIERDHGIPVATTKKFINWMNREFPLWAKWRQNEYNTAITEGRLTNPFGFSRYFWSGNIRSMAYSFGPQSVPAHMMKRVVPQLMRELPKPARLVLSVHDATLVTYPEEIEKEVIECMNEVMTQQWTQLDGWKAGCSIGTGKNFQECSED